MVESREALIFVFASMLHAYGYRQSARKFERKALGVKYYARYTDDFIGIAESEEYLRNLLEPRKEFLKDELQLELHPNKLSIRKYRQGADFLGYVILPHRRQLRTKTKRRVMKKIKQRLGKLDDSEITDYEFTQSLASYQGVLQHANTYN